MSLSERIAAASPAHGSEDSIDAIRNAAIEALEEARAIKEQSFADRTTSVDPEVVPGAVEDAPAGATGTEFPEAVRNGPPDVHLDYSPSVEPPVRLAESTDDDDDDDDEPTPVESRYSRNSAKLPRIGVDASSASSTIANLRKQMTADD
jgi:hypothetical protein